MTSDGDSFSVASSSRACSTAPTTPGSTNSSRGSHKNLRRGTVDPRLNDEEEYDGYDPFAQDDSFQQKEEAVEENDKEKFCFNTLKHASLRLIQDAQKTNQSEAGLRIIKDLRHQTNQKKVVVLRRPEHARRGLRGRELGRAGTPALSPQDQSVILPSATQQATASVPPPTTQTEATSPIAVDTEDANHALVNPPEQVPRSTSAYGNDFHTMTETLMNRMDKMEKNITKRSRIKKRKATLKEPLKQDRIKRRMLALAKANQNTPKPVIAVVENDENRDGAEDTIPAEVIEEQSNLMRLVFQEMQVKATTKIVDKEGLPQIPTYIWDDFQEHFVNNTTPINENKATFLCWHKDIQDNKRKKNDLEFITEFYYSPDNKSPRSHFYFCLQKANKKTKNKEPDPDVNICLKLILIQDEVWKEFV